MCTFWFLIWLNSYWRDKNFGQVMSEVMQLAVSGFVATSICFSAASASISILVQCTKNTPRVASRAPFNSKISSKNCWIHFPVPSAREYLIIYIVFPSANDCRHSQLFVSSLRKMPDYLSLVWKIQYASSKE